MCLAVNLFFLLPLIFILVAASSHFLTASKIFTFFSQQNWSPLFFISLPFKIVKQRFLRIILKVWTPPYIVWFQKISIPLPRKIIGNSDGEFSWVPSILREAFTTSTA